MRYKWLNKTNTDKLIIFFNGWGMDDYIVSGLDFDGFDVLMFYDYVDLSLPIDKEIIDNYKEKHVLAWSMGVMVATLFDFGQTTSTALCGSPYPINDEYGIPEKVYNLTIRGFSEKSLLKFLERMFIEPPKISVYSKRSLESQKKELIALKNYSSNPKYIYTKVVVPDKDMIIPTKNQLNYWGEFANLEIISSGHCPFYNYRKWSELL